MGNSYGDKLLIGRIEFGQRLLCWKLNDLAIGSDGQGNQSAESRIVLMVIDPSHKCVTYAGFACKA